MTGKNRDQALLLITCDEHGGCYDHTSAMFGATTPDAAGNPGESGIHFNRFGVHVPTVLISLYRRGSQEGHGTHAGLAARPCEGRPDYLLEVASKAG